MYIENKIYFHQIAEQLEKLDSNSNTILLDFFFLKIVKY